MIYLNNNKIYRLGGSNRAYLNGKLCYQAYVPKEEILPYWNITYNDWQAGSEGDKLSGHQVYVTNKNNGKIRITFGGYEEFTIQIRTNHTSTSSYTLIGELNYDWVNSTTTPTYSSAHIVDNTRDTKKTWAPYTFTNLNPQKEYFVDVISKSTLDGYWNFLAIPSVPLKQAVWTELNNQWELSTVSCDEGYTTFQSYSNKGVGQTVGARMRIHFSGYDNFSFKYRSEGWSSYIYLCVGDVDVDLSSKVDSIRYNSTGVKYNTRGNATPKEWKDAEYSNLDTTIEHFIDVIYIKTYGASFNEDRGFIGVMTSKTMEKWEASSTEYVTVNNGGGSYTFYTLEYKYISVDDGKTWIPTTASRQGETELTQSLVAVEGHICNNGNKYSKNEIYVELGGNLVGTEIYSRGDLIEEGAEDCQVVEIEWIANTQTVVSSSTKPSDLQDVWFDFNVPITKNIKFQVDFTLMYMSGGMLVGNKNYGGTNEEWRFFSYWANKAFLFDNWSGGSSETRLWAKNVAEVNTRYNLEVGNFYIKNLTTNTTLSSYNAYNRTYDGKYISLWCGTKKTEPSDGAKIHSLKIYESDTLVRDLVPAKNSVNQVGLYDKLNGTFYLPQGTGTLYHS